MSDSLQFQKAIKAYGGKPGKPSPELLTFLREKQVSDEAVAFLTGYAVEKSAFIGPVDFYAEDGWIGANSPDYIPIALRDGLLIVGTCPNGDPVAVDVRDKLGEAGYIGHEKMWKVSNVREAFAVIAPGLGALAYGLDQDQVPVDYYEAISKNK